MKNNTDKKNKNKIKKKWFLGTIIIFLVMSAFWGMFFWRAYESDGSTWTLRTLPNTPNVSGWTHWGQNGYAIVNKGNNKSYLYIYGEHYRSGSTSKPSVFKLNMLKWDNSKGFVHYKTIANGIYKNNRKRFYNGGDQALWKMENGVYAFQHQATIGGKSHTGDIDRSVTYSNWVSVGANENNKVALLYYDSKNKDSKLVIRSGQAKSKVQSVTANATDGIVLDIRGAMVIKASSQDSKDFDNGTQVAFDKAADLYHVKGDDSTSATGSTLYLRDADGKVHYSTHSGSEYKANETEFRYGKKNMKIPVSTLKDLPNGRYYLDYQISVKSGSQFSTSKDKSSLVAPSSSDLKSFKMKANDGYDRNYKIYETTGGNFGIHITDATPPTANTSQSPTSWTNRDVKLTVSGISDKGGSGYKRTTRPNGTTSTSTSVSQDVSSNGTYKFVIGDNDGNKTTKTFTVSNIDKTAPTADLTQTPTSWTNGNVTLKLTNVKDSGSGYYRTKLPDGSFVTTTSVNYTVTTNGTYSFTIYDHAGNSTTKSIEVKNIDKVKPTASVKYSTTKETKENVTVTVSVKDNLSGVKSIRLPNGTALYQSTFSYTVSKNGSHSFVVTDYAGNSTTVTATVSNIDKTPPSLILFSSTEDWTNESIFVTAIASDNVGVRKIVLPNKSEVNGSRAIYTIEGNETYTFEVFDTVGNKTTKSIQITNFDNRVPTVNIETLNEMSNKIDVKLEYGDK